MKSRAIAGLAALFVGVPGIAEAQSPGKVLVCTPAPGRLGAPRYELKLERAGKATLYKVPLNPTARKTKVVTGSTPVRYGEATIFTVNAGRSGYAHLYSHGTVAVVDINLFQRRHLNTGGPLTGLTCRWRGPGSGEVAGACRADADCVAAQCCHPTSCTSASAPNCSGMMCTMECRAGTMDCGQGSCRCESGVCKAVFQPR